MKERLLAKVAARKHSIAIPRGEDVEERNYGLSGAADVEIGAEVRLFILISSNGPSLLLNLKILLNFVFKGWYERATSTRRWRNERRRRVTRQ